MIYQFKCSNCGNNQIQEVLIDPDYAEEPVSDITEDSEGRIDLLVETAYVFGGEVDHYECTACSKVLKDEEGDIIANRDDLRLSDDITLVLDKA